MSEAVRTIELRRDGVGGIGTFLFLRRLRGREERIAEEEDARAGASPGANP